MGFRVELSLWDNLCYLRFYFFTQASETRCQTPYAQTVAKVFTLLGRALHTLIELNQLFKLARHEEAAFGRLLRRMRTENDFKFR